MALENEHGDWLEQRVPVLTAMRNPSGGARAYVCVNFTCHAPVSSPAELRQLLAAIASGGT